MNYCSACGEKVSVLIPEGDNRLRHVCEHCGTIHYQNPKIVTGCIPEWENKILLCRRAIEPKSGLWTLPAGFMENAETNLEGAAREAREEANAEVRDMKLFTVFSIPHISQVYTFYRGVLHQGKASTGEETLEVALFDEQNIPWNELAFPVVKKTLELYFSDREKGDFKTHCGEIIKQPDNKLVAEVYV